MKIGNCYGYYINCLVSFILFFKYLTCVQNIKWLAKNNIVIRVLITLFCYSEIDSNKNFEIFHKSLDQIHNLKVEIEINKKTCEDCIMKMDDLLIYCIFFSIQSFFIIPQYNIVSKYYYYTTTTRGK